ncbi:unnamed protein product [Fusarium equiseti]|uniref:Uncharacterized protein n=1 Tax=Fusarium equiseti TaxID=61235 RepID=A0A8J2ISP7_FUSEQ|nr:unnamed protein product [Fusarium equiseti]
MLRLTVLARPAIQEAHRELMLPLHWAALIFCDYKNSTAGILTRKKLGKKAAANQGSTKQAPAEKMSASQMPPGQRPAGQPPQSYAIPAGNPAGNPSQGLPSAGQPLVNPHHDLDINILFSVHLVVTTDHEPKTIHMFMDNVSIRLLECIYWPGLSLEGVIWPVIRHLQVPAEPVCNFPDRLQGTLDPGGL